MKKSLLILIAVLIRSIVTAGSFNNNFDSKTISNKPESIVPDDLSRQSFIINAFDTVVFDLSQAVVAGGYIEFPVSVLSGDTINALDFSFRYNHAKLIYDSIYNLTSYVIPYSYYNTMDSTVRFTSNSFQRYGNDTSLVSIRFMMLAGSIINTDLNSIVGYLNGDVCSVKIINPLPNSIRNIDENKMVKVYPNPVNQVLKIEATENASFELLDMDGGQRIKQTAVNANQVQEINTREFDKGIYFLRIYNNNFVITKKIAIY